MTATNMPGWRGEVARLLQEAVALAGAGEWGALADRLAKAQRVLLANGHPGFDDEAGREPEYDYVADDRAFDAWRESGRP